MGDRRTVAADRDLERLQRDAGSRLGAPLALPQLAAIARIASQLKIPVSRRAVAAATHEDIDMWVRAVPDDEGVALTIERWDSRPPVGPRLASVGDSDSGPLSSVSVSCTRSVSASTSAALLLMLAAA